MRKMAAVLALALGLPMAGMAAPMGSVAMALPEMDVAASCAAMEERLAGQAEGLQSECVQAEGVARKELEKVWADTPARTQAYCTQMVAGVEKVLGADTGTYTTLWSCVHVENAAHARSVEAWSALPEANREVCLYMLDSGTIPSYGFFDMCMQGAR